MKNYLNSTVLCALLVATSAVAQNQTFKNPSDSLSKYANTAYGCIASVLSEAPFWFPSFFKNANENLMFKISKIKAKRVFWNAYDTVPGYRDFIDTQCPTMPEYFTDIPVMSKSNFIKKYPIEQTLKGGHIPIDGFMDPSSGTSGRRTLWIRGKDEINNAQKMMNLVRSMFLEGQNYVVINMFLPSAWFLGLMRGLGPNVAEAYETLKDLGTQPKYLIMGHTSLIEFFVKSSPFDLAPFDITLLIGGEHMSRALHATFLEKGIKRVYSGYGASDIHFTVGIQEEFIQELQRLCWSNPTLQAELTGKLNGHPYFFQYSPLHDYIEEIDGHLIFTDLDHTRLSPRIRYDLGDRGKVLKMSFVQKVLQKHGISLEPRANLPLICLYGREEHTVMYNTIELAFDDLELAILNTPELGSVMNRYAYNVYEQQEGNKTLEFWVELKDGVSAEQFDAQDLEQKILSALAEVNFVFKQETNNGANASIPLKIYAYGTSPMLPESIMRKAKFVYNVQP